MSEKHLRNEDINKPFDPEEEPCEEQEGFARPAGTGGGTGQQGNNSDGGEPQPGH